MKAKLKQKRKLRIYSNNFKKESLAIYESGKFSVLQFEKLCGVSNTSIYRWICKFPTFNEKGFEIVETKERNLRTQLAKSSYLSQNRLIQPTK